MDDTRLRQLERQFKLRVKTGCGTCRIRRVKCDETKPDCLRCTKTGRKCEGYTHASHSRKSLPSAAASFRNSSFLSIPSIATPLRIARSPSLVVSHDFDELRSFSYFQSRTLPQWTEFFDSDLWSQQVLQLSHHEPAIRHGLLALSTMHEHFESTCHVLNAQLTDYAFSQYMKAVKHSNHLLALHQARSVPVEKVLIACIIFICYENLAGNYVSAAMHLRNGMRILAQHHRSIASYISDTTTLQYSIANILYRFDFQAMTFSDRSSPYIFESSNPPSCPPIPPTYATTTTARNDLVAILRSLMWTTNIAETGINPAGSPIFLAACTQLADAFAAWTTAFETFRATLPAASVQDPKTYAGITLLRTYSAMFRAIIETDIHRRVSWDARMPTFRQIVELVETLPYLSAPVAVPINIATPPSPALPSSTPLPRPSTCAHLQAKTKSRTLVPAPSPSSQVLPYHPCRSSSSTPSQSSTPPPISSHATPSFSPSFELSPIVPLFVVATRCRDPILRRRAIALLARARRREGVWDSIGAAAVAVEVVKIEEGLEEVEVGDSVGGGGVPGLDSRGWLPLGRIREAAEIPESARVGDVITTVSVLRREVKVVFVRGVEALEKFERVVKF
ncbi:hypothetical protein K432DRAFT_387935 [Lepidopterella palustris CBS 459.81]|uniref:Zn(2)-C6 fungal-type domain-containing protein n=1 Tax=Lepidopterella palustris CBS 459.81 TaxID=1314670 RepID=A0A8E2ELP7_9PEZI|nr:hypothetical protein K432DRAFT_387935 [Lepidopterella palustris CBS 459.81]